MQVFLIDQLKLYGKKSLTISMMLRTNIRRLEISNNYLRIFYLSHYICLRVNPKLTVLLLIIKNIVVPYI